MRSDIAGLRTWLLAALGGWTLLLWGASLFGLGSRIGTGDAVASAPALPEVPRVQAAAGLDNAEAMARPLFAADRRPHPFSIGEPGETDTTGSVRLTGVLITPGLEMATLTTEQGQSLRLRMGAEPQAGWQLLSVEPRSAVVNGPAGTLNLELQVYNGGGAAAAHAGSASDAGAAPPLPAAAPTASANRQATPVPAPAAGAAEGEAAPAADPAGPSAAQIQAIRERIQARRRQAQQNQNGSSGSPKP
ncbi:hypothetical protein [Stenotrophomonas sp.]|uniref:hypothetical protein n=1 Tax=Stenotrophomonas sp. TaxID=69392 RepID=UPI0028AE2B2E|nr:hypothetical protein [Stenotrophomonas sp.]